MSFISEYNAVFKLLKEKQQVVFYAESRHYYQYFEKLIEDLIDSEIEICYITSDAKDPLLTTAPEKMKVIRVKWLLGFLFSKLKADVMIMTMPDLGNYLFKRSAEVGTYIYIFHAAVSTHQQYRKAAFFNYNAIFCTGEYQAKEIRKAEELSKLRAKNLISYGYPLLDKIKKSSDGTASREEEKPTILIAPSWFDGCIFDTCIEELLKELSKLPYKVVLRSHPEFEKRKKKVYKSNQQLIKQYPGMEIDSLPNVFERLQSTDILITDRSGIAFEFAFGIQKPVLFMDTLLKINNPDYKELEIEPIENFIRNEMGVSLSPENLEQIKDKLTELETMSVGFKQKMGELSSTIFYNSESAYKTGLDYIISNLRND